MKAGTGLIWRTELLRWAWYFGGLGVLIALVILVLPASYHEGDWNRELFAGLSKRVLLLGGVLGGGWGACVIGLSNPLAMLMSVALGVGLWSAGDAFSPLAAPVVGAVIGLAMGSMMAEDLVNEVKTVRGYASKAGAVGEERAQIIGKLIEAVGHPKYEALWTAAAEALRSFGSDGTEPILKHLEHAQPKARKRAAQALGIIGDPATVPALQALVQKEQDGAVKQAALEALARISSESS